MLRKTIQHLAQIVGFITIVLLAIYGSIALLNNSETVRGESLTPMQDASGTFRADAKTLDMSTDSTVASEIVPQHVSYQGTLFGPDGQPLTGTYAMTFRIYNEVNDAIENAAWSEQHPTVTVKNGQFSVLLGQESAITKELFIDQDQFIGVTVDGFDEMLPRQRFASVPFAIAARHANGLSSANGNNLDAVYVDEIGRVGIGTYSPQHELQIAAFHTNNANIGLKAGDLPSMDIFGGLNDAGLYGYGNRPLKFMTNETPRMTIDASGNVGIGTLVPTQELHIVENDGNADLRLQSGSHPHMDVYSGEKRAGLYNYGEKDLVFATKATDRMIISPDGRVTVHNKDEISGILLDVKGNTSVDGNFYVKDNSVVGGNMSIDTLSLGNIPACLMVGFKDNDVRLRWGSSTCPNDYHRLESHGRGWQWDGQNYGDSHVIFCCPK